MSALTRQLGKASADHHSHSRVVPAAQRHQALKEVAPAGNAQGPYRFGRHVSPQGKSEVKKDIHA